MSYDPPGPLEGIHESLAEIIFLLKSINEYLKEIKKGFNKTL